jgi:SAM-dependent methyltransferase
MDSLCCPDCAGDLSPGEASWSCCSCRRAYPALCGIPDLRRAEDAFLSNAEDWRFARALSADFDRTDFGGLLARYYELVGDVPPDRRAHQIAHIRAAPERGSSYLKALGLRPEDRSPLLDLGCGPGGFLVRASREAGGRTLWGVDIGLRWLLLARKQLDEAGAGHVRLACAGSEDLPFRDATFGGIVAGDVIEHVADQAATLAEAHRVLRPGGRVFLTTPNRYSLTPEPHVGVLGVGYLPRAWMGGYVRLARGLPYRAIRNRGWRDWVRLLRQSPFGGGVVTAPVLSDDEIARFPTAKRLIAGTYNRIVETGCGQFLARAVGPMFHMIAQRCEQSPPIPLSTPPGSSPGAARASSAHDG